MNGHVSTANRARALAAIEQKRDLLRLWARSGIPERRNEDGEELALEWVPSSLREFCRWDGSQNSAGIGTFSRTAAQTLSIYTEIKREVVSLMLAVASQAAKRKELADPKGIIASLKAELAEERALRAGALLSYRASRAEVRRCMVELTDERRAHRQSLEELGGRLQRSEQEAAELRSKVASLTATLNKVAPIRALG